MLGTLCLFYFLLRAKVWLKCESSRAKTHENIHAPDYCIGVLNYKWKADVKWIANKVYPSLIFPFHFSN